MNKVLITGSSGFLGKHLCSFLSDKNIPFTALNSTNCNLCSDSSLDNFIRDPSEYDFIFHLAAWTQAGTFCDTHRGIQWVVNQKINTNVLDFWAKKMPQAKMIAFGTSVSYAIDNPLEESFYMDKEPYDKFYSYAYSKRMLLVGLECLAKQYSLNYLYFIPSTLYGPDYHLDDRQPHFIYDLINKVLRGKYLNESVSLWGDGEQKRELVYVNDFVEIMYELATRQNNQIINIGAGKEYTIKHFADLICKKIGYDFEDIKFDVTKYVGAKSKCLDITKLKSILPEYELTPLEIGLDKTIDWFIGTKSY